jgi:hypothetical protein
LDFKSFFFMARLPERDQECFNIIIEIRPPRKAALIVFSSTLSNQPQTALTLTAICQEPNPEEPDDHHRPSGRLGYG